MRGDDADPARDRPRARRTLALSQTARRPVRGLLRAERRVLRAENRRYRAREHSQAAGGAMPEWLVIWCVLMRATGTRPDNVIAIGGGRRRKKSSSSSSWEPQPHCGCC
jgi:hypothetical protein